MKNEITPKISVIITNYNYGEYIQEAINSVKNQTFTDFELIVIDDNSSDKITTEKIGKIAKDQSIKLIQNKENQGVGKSRNIATEKAKGEYIIYLDADDFLKNDCLEKMYDKITQGYDLIGCGYEIFGDKSGKIINKYSKYDMCQQCLFPISALFKKSHWQKIGGLIENTEGEHYNFLLGLIDNGAKVFIIQEALLFYRKHGISRNNSALQKGKELEDKLFIERVKNYPKLFAWFIQETIISNKKAIKNSRRIRRILKISVVLNLIFLINFFSK